MIRLTGFMLLLSLLSWGRVSDQEIANMFILGFEGKTISADSQILKDICNLGLGGVILFKKNIGSKSQLKKLTDRLSSCIHKPLIATDQEGGKVRRIRYGIEYPRASIVASKGASYANTLYGKMAKELRSLGINYNLAPVADLDIEPRNYIIHKLGRSYGADPKRVKYFDEIFIKAMHKYHVLTALKHFPGHGSSLGDTHNGFVDISKVWQNKELEPFKHTSADSIMVAHVVWDKSGIPASLSKSAIRRLRRYNPDKVVITDDLQMGAIRKIYPLKTAIKMAINAGDDLLLFGNQLTNSGKVSTVQLIKIVRDLLKSNQISSTSIKQANRRINRIRRKAGLTDNYPARKYTKRNKNLHKKTSAKRKSQKDMY